MIHAKFFTRLALLALVAGGSSTPGAAQDSDLPTLIVAPFSGDKTHIQYWQPALGEGLAEMLITELGKLNKFTLLETTQLGVLKDEIGLGEDGWVDAAEKVAKGGFAGADFMFTAKVTRFGAKNTGVNLGGIGRSVGLGNLGVKQNTADVRIDWRLVDAANRKVIKTGSATAENRGTSFNTGVFVNGSGGSIGFDNQEFMDSSLGKATVLALEKIVADVRPVSVPASGRRMQQANQAAAQASAQATQAAQVVASATAAFNALRSEPGKILAVAAKDIVIVSLGSKHGYKNGDSLNLYEPMDVKDDKGVVVFTDEKHVGEITLQSVQAERSRASYAGDLNIQAGWIVKAK